jgi:MOSC domain-containing protein YiiM
MVTAEGMSGDSHAHPNIHGGPKKALLIATSEGIEELREAGYPMFAGALGENITTQGLDRRTVRAGQRYRIGDVVVEIVKVRQPCETLNVYGQGIQKTVYDAGTKAGDASAPRWGLSGFYCSVVQPGTIRPGDPVVFLDQSV